MLRFSNAKQTENLYDITNFWCPFGAIFVILKRIVYDKFMTHKQLRLAGVLDYLHIL